MQIEAKFDAAEAAFITRTLLWVENQTYDILIPPMEGRRFVPVDTSTPAGAKFTAYRQYTRLGIARLITEAGADLPNASIFVKEFQHQFYAIGASYTYDYFDLLAAALASQNGGPPLNLDLELARAAREAIEKKLDVIAAVGSAATTWALENEIDVGMVGLLNNPNATIYAVANGYATGTTPWSGKTPDEIIADLTGVVAGQISGTYKVHTPDSMILPVAQMESIMGRSMGDGRSDTILSYFMKTNRHIKEVDSWNYCQGAGSGSTDRGVAYAKDPRYVRHMLAMDFTQLPAQQKKLVFEVPCIAKTAGVIMPYPLSVSYFDGI